MKKVLIVMLAMYNGGAERSLVNMLNELPSDKYDIDLLCFKKQGMFLSHVPEWVNIIDQTPNLKKLYAPVAESGRMMPTKVIGTVLSRIFESETGMRIGFRWQNFYSKKIEKLNKRYDVAIAYVAGEPMFYICDKVDADKRIVWIHNDFRSAKYPKKYSHKYFKKMELVTISDECARIVKEEFSDLNKEVYSIANISSSTVIKNEALEFYPDEYKKDELKILSIGRLTEQKGFDLAIEAAALLKNRGIDFKWYVIGDGILQRKLESLIKEKHVDDCFFLIGARENPYPYINSCDVFAQTSRFEGKSVVLDEAKILAIPIVVTKYPTVYDQINAEEGLVVNMDPESVADGLEKMIKDSKLRKAYKNYLESREYGNQDEIQKYIALIGD